MKKKATADPNIKEKKKSIKYFFAANLHKKLSMHYILKKKIYQLENKRYLNN